MFEFKRGSAAASRFLGLRQPKALKADSWPRLASAGPMMPSATPELRWEDLCCFEQIKRPAEFVSTRKSNSESMNDLAAEEGPPPDLDLGSFRRPATGLAAESEQRVGAREPHNFLAKPEANKAHQEQRLAFQKANKLASWDSGVTRGFPWARSGRP